MQQNRKGRCEYRIQPWARNQEACSCHGSKSHTLMRMNLTAESHSIPLSDGNSMPLMGLGTYGDPRTVSHNTYLPRLPMGHADFISLSFAISWQTPKGTAYESVKLAIDIGYRHIDGALVYFNEHEVGQAIREKIADGTVKREDIFYCGKVCLSVKLQLTGYMVNATLIVTSYSFCFVSCSCGTHSILLN